MEFAVGGAEIGRYLPLLEEELAHRGEDRRAPDLDEGRHRAGRAVSRSSSSAPACRGSLAAHRLQQAGVDFVVIEKNPDVGGTWFENQYPGCRVDNPNHNYSYSFAQRHDWPLHFSTQPVLLDYFRQCADAFGVRDHIRFGTEVHRGRVVRRRPRLDGHACATADGTEEVLDADAVISAVGQLNRPKYPTTIPGFDSFEGPAFHSARWDHDVDLTGKRVAVIGTGASAVQFVPEIAPVGRRAAGLPAHARRGWARRPTTTTRWRDGLRWLYRARARAYSEWNRFWIFWRMGDGSIAGVEVDPEWDGRRRVGQRAQRVHAPDVRPTTSTSEFADRPDLLAKVHAALPAGRQAHLRDNGIVGRRR